MEACPGCGNKRFVVDEARGEESCSRCGLVRDLPPIAQPSHLQSTPPGRNAKERLPIRLQRWDRQRGEPGNVHRLRLAQDEARRMAAALGCPLDVGERAATLLARARKARLTQGRSLDAFAPAALMASCRLLLLARTEKEITAASRVSWAEVQAAYKALVRGLALEVPALTAKEYLGQVASAVGLDGRVQAEAYRILQPICGTTQSAGKSPLGWSAAALLLAARAKGKAPSVGRMAEAAGVSPSTLLARANELQDRQPASP
ncbi:MAG: transcription initiation factor IIB family protein [Candidatus Thermoplasmatota archaeon]